jgi:hypothetical protein
MATIVRLQGENTMAEIIKMADGKWAVVSEDSVFETEKDARVNRLTRELRNTVQEISFIGSKTLSDEMLTEFERVLRAYNESAARLKAEAFPKSWDDCPL